MGFDWCFCPRLRGLVDAAGGADVWFVETTSLRGSRWLLSSM